MSTDDKEAAVSENGCLKKENESLFETKLEFKNASTLKAFDSEVGNKSSTEILTELFSAFNAEPPVIEEGSGDGEKPAKSAKKNSIHHRSSESAEDSACDKVKEKKGEKKKKEKKKKHKRKSSKHRHSSKKETETSGLNRLHRSREKDKDDIATYSKIKEKLLKASASSTKSTTDSVNDQNNSLSNKGDEPKNLKFDSTVDESVPGLDSSVLVDVSCENENIDLSKVCLPEPLELIDNARIADATGENNRELPIENLIEANNGIPGSFEIDIIPLPEDCASQERSSSGLLKAGDISKISLKSVNSCDYETSTRTLELISEGVRTIKNDCNVEVSKLNESRIVERIEDVAVPSVVNCDCPSIQKPGTCGGEKLELHESLVCEGLEIPPCEKVEPTASDRVESSGKNLKPSSAVAESKVKSKIKIKNLKFSTVFQQTLKEAEEQARKKEEEKQEEQVKSGPASQVVEKSESLDLGSTGNIPQNESIADISYPVVSGEPGEKNAEETVRVSKEDSKLSSSETKEDAETSHVSLKKENFCESTKKEKEDHPCKEEQDLHSQNGEILREVKKEKSKDADASNCKKRSRSRSVSKTRVKEKKKRGRSRSKSREKTKKNKKRINSPTKAKSRSRSLSKRKRRRSRSGSKGRVGSKGTKKKARSHSRSKDGKKEGLSRESRKETHGREGRKAKSRSKSKEKRHKSHSREGKKAKSRSRSKEKREKSHSREGRKGRSRSKSKEMGEMSRSQERKIGNRSSIEESVKSYSKGKGRGKGKGKRSRSRSKEKRRRKSKSVSKERDKSRSQSVCRNDTSISPEKSKSVSPKKRVSDSPDKSRSVSPEKSRSCSPNVGSSDSLEKIRSVSPKDRSASPKDISASPKDRSASPKEKSASPRKSPMSGGESKEIDCRGKSEGIFDETKKSRSRSGSRQRSMSENKGESADVDKGISGEGKRCHEIGIGSKIDSVSCSDGKGIESEMKDKHASRSRSKSLQCSISLSKRRSRSGSLHKSVSRKRSKSSSLVPQEKRSHSRSKRGSRSQSHRKSRSRSRRESKRRSQSRTQQAKSSSRRKSRSRSRRKTRSRSRRKSRSRSRRKSGSRSRRKSRSRSRKKSRSRSRRKSRSRSRRKSRSRSRRKSRSRSRRKSRSRSRKISRSRSRRKTRSRSRRRSHSKSRRKSRSRSRRKSRSKSRRKSRSRSRRKSRSRSRRKSRSRSRRKSRSRSRRKSRSRSRKKSRSRSRRKSRSRSRKKSRSRSRKKSRSRSRKKSRSRSRRRSRSSSRKRSLSLIKCWRKSRSQSHGRRSRERSKGRGSNGKKSNLSRKHSRSPSVKKRSPSCSKMRSKSAERRSRSRSRKRSKGEKEARRSKTLEKTKLAAAGGTECAAPAPITSGDVGKSGEGEEEKLDKARLLEIARKNAVNLLQQGSLPPSVVGKDQKGKLLSLKAGGKSVEELTEYCKELSRKEAMGESSDSDCDGGSGSGSHAAQVIHHPFQIKERPTPGMIGIGIRTSLPPANAIMDKPSDQSKLRMQFPVSSGQEHRKTESDSPLAICYHEEPSPVEEIELVPGDILEEKEKIVVDPRDQVFPDYSNCEQNMDIGSIVSQRLTALRKLQENPDDVDALNEMTQAQKDMQVWAESKSQPGLFTGSTGAKVLSAAELASGSQAWARKDQLKCATPLTGGMGMLLLQKMGWRPGEGLGKNKEGVLEPLRLDVKTDKRGLVSQEELHRHTNVHRRGHVTRSHSRHSFGKHPVSVLVEICSKRRWKVPHFQLVFESGPDHKKSFLFKAIVNGVEYLPPAPSPNKKQAKAHAASICLQAIGVYPPSMGYEGACV